MNNDSSLRCTADTVGVGQNLADGNLTRGVLRVSSAGAPRRLGPQLAPLLLALLLPLSGCASSAPPRTPEPSDDRALSVPESRPPKIDPKRIKADRAQRMADEMLQDLSSQSQDLLDRSDDTADDEGGDKR